ncbi:hypothetical protein KJ359_002570 [Pestalotiopsis sp. 9143b]|nr:hypothetical protein KJ359_002570 [Pestalotiopsis sp. 9143b]
MAASIARTMSALLALAAATTATPIAERVKRDECSTYRVVKDWNDLTSSEQSDYLDAELCLTQYPATMDLGGSKTYWDEIQYNHITQADWVHFVGHFLPWHRYLVSVHANALRDYCGYTGPLAYWNEESDASSLSDIKDSAIFQPDAFGGNATGVHECIADGPFINVTLAFQPGSSFFTNADMENNTCIYPDLSLSSLQSSDFDECQQENSFEDMWNCVENGPHANGHGAVGGLMGDVANSPGDPVFFLHHHFIDLQWWKWQVQDLDARLTEIGGTNGDNGNTTTLNHVLWMMDLYENVTVADVMSINYTAVCLTYEY